MLAIDAGNSRLKFGLFVPSQSSFYRRTGLAVSKIASAINDFPSCREFLAIPAGDSVPWRTISNWCPDGAVVAGSNPHSVEQVLKGWPSTGLPTPLVIRDRKAIPVPVDVDYPDKVGLDRLLNTVAANALRPASRPAIVIDSGTATTLNFISTEGVFCGGAAA